MSGGRFPVSHRNVVCVVRKNSLTQNLKLEFNDTFKTNNSSSQEANDLLYLLEQTVDLHSVQLYTKSRDVSDHIAGYVAIKAVKFCKDCCSNCLESFASAPAHGDSYISYSLEMVSNTLLNNERLCSSWLRDLDASSATILKSTLPSEKAGQITLTLYLD